MTAKIHSLLDILLPRKVEIDVSPDLSQYKFRYYAGSGAFKGTNDEVIGWNSKRPGWVGFLTPAGHRWYIHRNDITPESWEVIQKILEEKDELRNRRREERKRAEIERSKRRKSSLLDGREREIEELRSGYRTTNSVAATLGVSWGTANRKILKMEKKR